MLRIITKIGIALLILFILFMAFAYWYDSTGQRPDLSFDTSVRVPAYVTEHPIISFDTAHNNFHTPAGRYRPLVELLKNDGYIVRENVRPFKSAALDSIRVLVIANAMGPDGHEGHAAFDAGEDSILVDWVRRGDSL